MLLLTGTLMLTAFTDLARAEADQRYFPQEADWISQKVWIFLFSSDFLTDATLFMHIMEVTHAAYAQF